ncbi:hypothetical protein AGMMS49975_21590 [Clostridia bacterium]|nr:hypothetical protein AGMMS49975_21590 [Clostridia bacterium]
MGGCLLCYDMFGLIHYNSRTYIGFDHEIEAQEKAAVKKLLIGKYPDRDAENLFNLYCGE